MKDCFRIETEIHTLQGSVPIRFVHARNMDRPENHHLHLNNYVEIYVYMEGDHQYIVEDSLFPLKRGDMMIISPQEVHKAVAAGEVLYERFYFLVDVRAFEKMHFDPLQPILNRSGRALNLISPDDETRAMLVERLYAISRFAKEGKEFSALCAFLTILDCIQLQLEENNPQSVSSYHAPELLRKIFAYVAENVKKIQTVSEIADALGVTPQYLSSYFSKQAGTSLKKYLQAKKIALAKELLSKGANVTESCFDSGFNDSSYFIKVFQKYVGCTPKTYLQRMEEKS